MKKSNILEEIYQSHHCQKGRENFSYFEKQRAKVLIKLIGSGKKILDLGCRDGTLTKYFIKDNEVLGVDIDRDLLIRCRSRLGIQIKQFDLNSLVWPFKKNYYDIVVAGEILEHLFNPEMAVRQIRSLLNSGGMLIGSVPNSFHILDRFGFLFGKVPRGMTDPTHINMFSLISLRHLLSRDFPLIKIIPITVNKFSIFAHFFPSLFADDFLFIAKK